MIEKIRILLVGYSYDERKTIMNKIEPRKDEEIIIEYSYGEKLPTLYSFHIIIFRPKWLREYGNRYFSKNRELDKFDITQFFNSPYSGCLIYPLVKKDPQLFLWFPSSNLQIHNSLIDRNGNDIDFNENHWLYPFIKEVIEFTNFSWLVHKNLRVPQLPEAQRKNYIAANLADFPVAWEEKYGNSIVLFLPYFYFANIEKEVIFLRKLIDIVKKRIISPIKTPPIWIENQFFKFEDEKELEKYIQELSKKKQIYDRVRTILWEDGYELTRSVTFVLNQMGIKAEMKEKRGKEDIEILEDNFKAIAEVKGLKGYASNRDLRQLMDWKRDKIIEKPEVEIKGIFIINHFKEAVPTERERLCKEKLKHSYPFTEDAIRIAKREDFCLFTTFQLFKIFRLFKEKRIGKPEIIKLLKETSGFLEDKAIENVTKRSVL